MYSVSCVMYKAECIPTSIHLQCIIYMHAFIYTCIQTYVHAYIGSYMKRDHLGRDSSGGSKPLNLMIKSCLERK